MSRWIACLLVPLLMVGLVSKARAELYGGTSRADITPPVGCWLAGWASRDKPSEGVHDPLFAKSVVLCQGVDTVAIVACDLIHITREIAAEARAIIERETGIAGGRVMISATHTHFSPEVGNRAKAGDKADEAYLDVLARKIASTVIMAVADMQPVKIGTSYADLPELLYNRRTRRPDGKVTMTFALPAVEDNLEFGPTDPSLGVMRVEDSEGVLLASMINYACHPVSGGGHGTGWESWFYDVSAEFPGVATALVESAESGNCLFTLGAAGNMVPIERGISPRFKIGKALGGETVRLLQFMETSADIILAVGSRQVELPLKNALEKDSYVKLPKSGKLEVELQVVRIGGLYLVALPGEVLVEVGTAIKDGSGGEQTLIVSLANGSIGYICHREAYGEGGYEPGRASVLAPGAAELLAARSLEMISELKQVE
jgi:neutral ceramidase